MSDEKKPVDDVTGIETTGHVWDGIEELNNPLPRWWLWTLYLTIIWSIGYVIAYPAWPLINGATPGLLGYSTRGEVAAEIAAVDAANADLNTQLAAADLTTLAENEELFRYATAAGGAVFRSNCSQCHGSGAAGAFGFPNLLDDDWLWGGSFDEIVYSIRHGIRNEEDWDARYSEMPAFGEFLETDEIVAIEHHVLAISGSEHDAGLAQIGSGLFLDNCSSCHGETGEGMHELGAPDLTDAIWLYGGDLETLDHSIRNARFGVMPAWGERLSDAEIQAVAAYVHQLGGGE